jgi:hypothetical protein
MTAAQDTFTWGIASLDRNLPSGEVYSVHWIVTATREGDGGAVLTSSTYGSIGLPAGDPESEDFVPYNELTPELVLQWTQEALGGIEKVAEIEAALTLQLDEQAFPSRASGTPW